MLKIIFGLVFTFFALEANCQKDLENIVHFYYTAEKKLDIKEYEKAITNFQKSANSSYLALDSCVKEDNYDFNHSYNYIIASENKIQKNKEDMLEFSLVKK